MTEPPRPRSLRLVGESEPVKHIAEAAEKLVADAHDMGCPPGDPFEQLTARLGAILTDLAKMIDGAGKPLEKAARGVAINLPIMLSEAVDILARRERWRIRSLIWSAALATLIVGFGTGFGFAWWVRSAEAGFAASQVQAGLHGSVVDADWLAHALAVNDLGEMQKQCAATTRGTNGGLACVIGLWIKAPTPNGS